MYRKKKTFTLELKKLLETYQLKKKQRLQMEEELRMEKELEMGQEEQNEPDIPLGRLRPRPSNKPEYKSTTSSSQNRKRGKKSSKNVTKLRDLKNQNIKQEPLTRNWDQPETAECKMIKVEPTCEEEFISEISQVASQVDIIATIKSEPELIIND